jgi:xylulokinase
MTAEELTGELGEDLHRPGALFLPYLSGERTPHNDALIRGALTGISHTTDRPAVTAAILQGVAFAFRDSQEVLAEAGTTIGRLVASGGGSRSRYWLKTIATALGVPIDVPAAGEVGAALGAARLGMLAVTRADPQSSCPLPRIDHTIEPDRNLAADFEAAYGRYKETYPALRRTLP